MAHYTEFDLVDDDDKTTVIITGCSNGIGEYLLTHWQSKWYNMYGIDKELCRHDQTVQVDLSNKKALKKIVGHFPKTIHGLVNMAGVCIRRSNVETLDRMYNDNVRSMYNMCDVFLPHLVRAKGSIVNISSIHAHSTLKLYGMYAGSKSMVEGLTRGLAVEYAPFDVHVNCIRLGPVKTRMLKHDPHKVKQIPSKRLVGKHDILLTVKMLLNNMSMTGSILTLDCGVTSRLGVDM